MQPHDKTPLITVHWIFYTGFIVAIDRSIDFIDPKWGNYTVTTLKKINK